MTKSEVKVPDQDRTPTQGDIVRDDHTYTLVVDEWPPGDHFSATVLSAGPSAIFGIGKPCSDWGKRYFKLAPCGTVITLTQQ